MDEELLPVVVKLRLITTSRNLDGTEWRTEVYDGGTVIYSAHKETKKESKIAATKWCFNNFTVPKSIEVLEWDSLAISGKVP